MDADETRALGFHSTPEIPVLFTFDHSEAPGGQERFPSYQSGDRNAVVSVDLLEPTVVRNLPVSTLDPPERIHHISKMAMF